MKAWLHIARRLPRVDRSLFSGEGATETETIFSATYLACAVIAFSASRMRSTPQAAASASFWLRIAVVCGLFAILRYADAHMPVSAAFRSMGHHYELPFWKRPGSYVMLGVIAASGIAVLGLLFFRPRLLPKSVQMAAMAIALLLLLVAAHSLSLYWTGLYLEAKVGTVNVSRIVEALLLSLIAAAGLWFRREARMAANADKPMRR